MYLRFLQRIVLLASILIAFSLESTLRIGFMGDVMLGRLVNEAIHQKGYDYPWGDMLPLLKENDINIINLETTLTTSNTPVPKVFNFKATPDKVSTLQAGNITVANTANNHILDFGTQGLIETLQTLDKAKIYHVGSGATSTQARTPVVLEKNGIKIGILGYTDNEPGWKATVNSPGTNYIKIGPLTREIKEDIQKLRPQVDVLIITIHWGPNMRQRPSPEFRDFAHQLIDLGVDIIHGHSAHIFQGVGFYKNGIIMYDTGDFIDDYAIDPVLKNNQSFLFTVILEEDKSEKGKYTMRLELVPVVIQNMQVNKAQGHVRNEILSKMALLSNELDEGHSSISLKRAINQ